MKLVPKAFKKVAITAVLTACLVSLSVSPAFAISDISSRMVSNVLDAEFHVAGAAENEVVLSWNADGTDIDLESFDLTKNELQTVTYYVSPKSGNDSDLNVHVLLKIPDESVAAIEELKIDNVTVTTPTLTEGGFSYYMLAENLLVEYTANDAHSGTFDIAFNQTTEQGSPFTASLIAVDATEPSNIFLVPGYPSYQANTTGELTFQYNTSDIVVNGVVTIYLGDGVLEINESDGSYGTYYDDTNGMVNITDEHYDAASKTLTLPMETMVQYSYYPVTLNSVTFADAGSYTFEFSMDSDGAGSAYTLTTGSFDYTLNAPN